MEGYNLLSGEEPFSIDTHDRRTFLKYATAAAMISYLEACGESPPENSPIQTPESANGLRGRILNTSDGIPVCGCRISAGGQSFESSDGNYFLPLNPGAYDLSIEGGLEYIRTRSGVLVPANMDMHVIKNGDVFDEEHNNQMSIGPYGGNKRFAENSIDLYIAKEGTEEPEIRPSDSDIGNSLAAVSGLNGLFNGLFRINPQVTERHQRSTNTITIEYVSETHGSGAMVGPSSGFLIESSIIYVCPDSSAEENMRWVLYAMGFSATQRPDSIMYFTLQNDWDRNRNPCCPSSEDIASMRWKYSRNPGATIANGIDRD